MILCSLVSVRAGCPFQNPFFFVDRPSALTVVDSSGSMVADRVRVSWGDMENFKCVDYFQIEYYEKSDLEATPKLTGKINRHRKSYDIDIKPCSEYQFKVIASEDWKGVRQDFKQSSETIVFKVNYTPKFIRPPIVKERRVTTRKRPNQGRRRRVPGKKKGKGKNGDESANEPPTPEPEIPYTIWVSWHLSYIDWPTCLNYFEFDYYDTVYNESAWMKTFKAPFATPNLDFEETESKIPCSDDFAFKIRVFGSTGDHSRDYWTPPSCITTTPAPTSPAPNTPTTTVDAGAFGKAMDTNEDLKEEISDLKQQYGPIGIKVWEAMKDSFFHSFEGYRAREQVLKRGDVEEVEAMAANFDDQFYALKYLNEDM